MIARNYNTSSKVESEIGSSIVASIPTYSVDNYIQLGRFTALRFLEWCSLNPGGVIALPTGKTPEFFIKWVQHYLDTWDTNEDIAHFNLSKPNFKNFHFFQIDEFFPINPINQKSFRYFVQKYYIDMMGFDPENVHLFDTYNIQGIPGFNNLVDLFNNGVGDINKLSKFPNIFKDNDRTVCQKYAIRKFKKVCKEYEKLIDSLGGIGFFLGGIGPDGHVAFNISGSTLDSKTRLLHLNYESSAAAASDLGGITNVNNKAVVTIGLDTIIRNPSCTAIIIAAGESKSKIVTETIKCSNFTSRFPASCVKKLKAGRFFVTNSAVKGIYEPMYSTLNVSAKDVEKKLKKGLREIKGEVILHTAPHHDDIELAYFPYIKNLVGKNKNYFAYCTNGYTSVTDEYTDEVIKNSKDWVNFYSSDTYDNELDYFFDIPDNIKHRISSLIQENEDTIDIKNLTKENRNQIKGWIRQYEAESMCRVNGIGSDNVFHLNLPFYSDDIFPKYPDLEKDVMPIFNLLEKINPTIITVALDPEGSGPDTHFKTLIAISKAVELYLDKYNVNLKIWGYRNVWSEFKLEDATTIIPVNYESYASFDELFKKCYKSQEKAEFPSYKFKGTFSKLALNIWKNQRFLCERVLGLKYFRANTNSALKSAEGLIFLKEMNYFDFAKEVDYIKRVLDDKNQLN